MAKCGTCGAPVNLAPDGDPRYDPPRVDRDEIVKLREYAKVTQYWKLEPFDQKERRAYLAKLNVR